MQKILCVFYAVWLTVIFTAASSRAASGDLDSTFYNHADPTLPVATCADCRGEAIIVQPDGKVLVAGHATVQNMPGFYVARYNADGSPDTTFDGDGTAHTAFGSGGSFGTSIALQPDGKTLVAGLVYLPFISHYGFAVARYNADGSPDAGFNGSGKATTSFTSLDIYAKSIAVRADGKIVVGGTTSNSDFVAVRYNANGSLDPTFNGGFNFIDINVGSYDSVHSIAIQADGKTVLAGESFYNNRNHFSLVRLTETGVLDAGFDGDGKLMTAVLYDSEARSVAIQPDGKIVAAGTAMNIQGDFGFAVVRYNPDGSLDSAFDGDGIVFSNLSPGYDLARSVKIQSDGKIIVGGKKADDDYAIVRYRANGAFDPYWGTGGIVSTGSGNPGGIDDIAVQPDERIVSVGTSNAAVYSHIFRFHNAIGTDPGPPCERAPSGLISWWQSELDAKEFIGENHGTLENDAGYGAGEVGQAFKFDGMDDAVFIGNPGSLDVRSITIEAWINPQNVPLWNLSNIVSKWGFDATRDSYLLSLYNDGGTIRTFGAIGDGVTGDPGFSGGAVPLNAWTHVAMTFDAGTAINRLYVNGALVAERSRKGGIYQTSTNVYIGREDSGNNRFFNGSIDEPAIYDRALQQQEIQRIVDAGYSGKCF